MLSELTDEALKHIETGLIANGAEANPDGLNNLMKMLRALRKGLEDLVGKPKID